MPIPGMILAGAEALGIGDAISGWVSSLFGGGGSSRPSAPSGSRWVKAWFLGGGEDGEYEPHYASGSTILEDLSSGLPAGRWSESASRLIPAAALTSQGVPIFSDGGAESEVVQEYLDKVWPLSAFAGATMERNASWAAKLGQPGPGPEPLEPEVGGPSGSAGSLVGVVLLVALGGYLLWKKAGR